MDADQVLTFLRIVREGSFGRAARSLNVAQPTVSARIRALEREVGGPLLTRGGPRPGLTEPGRAFLPYAHRALEVLGAGVEAARAARSGERGRVTVGCLESLTSGFLASALARFHASHPAAEVFVQTGHSDQVVEMLHDGVVGLGLVTWPLLADRLEPVLRFREPVVAVAAPGHPLATGGVMTLPDAVERASPFFLIPWGPAYAAEIRRACGRAGAVLEIPADMARHLLLRGVGASCLTHGLVADDVAAGRLVPLPIAGPPPFVRDGALVRLDQGEPLAAAAAAFVEAVRVEAGRGMVGACL